MTDQHHELLLAILDELRALRQESLAQASEIAGLVGRMARVLERWDSDGTPLSRD